MFQAGDSVNEPTEGDPPPFDAIVLLIPKPLKIGPISRTYDCLAVLKFYAAASVSERTIHDDASVSERTIHDDGDLG